MSTSDDNQVIVYGGGGHAKVLVATLQQSGRHIVAICDDDPIKFGTQILGVPVTASTLDLATDLAAVIAIGDNLARQHVAAANAERRWTTVIHPSAYVDPSARIGVGTVILAGAIIQASSVIGSHVIINTGATIDHDCLIDDFAHIGPGVNLAGGVRISRGAFLGIGSVVLPCVCIGEWTTVGAGGVVTRNLPDHIVALGVPAKARGVTPERFDA